MLTLYIVVSDFVGCLMFQKQGIFGTTAIVRLNRFVLQNVLIFWSI